MKRKQGSTHSKRQKHYTHKAEFSVHHQNKASAEKCLRFLYEELNAYKTTYSQETIYQATQGCLTLPGIVGTQGVRFCMISARMLLLISRGVDHYERREYGRLFQMTRTFAYHKSNLTGQSKQDILRDTI